MHMTMFGTWYGGEGGQQGCPSQEGGPRLIRFESPRWRPKATKVRARLGVQEQHVLKTMPRSRTVSVLGVLYMDGKIISWSFQWHQSHLKIPSQLTGIIETIARPESVRVLLHRRRQLNLGVSSFLSDPFRTFENRLLPNDVILIRNIGECHEGLRERGGGYDDQRGRPTETGGLVQHDFESALASRTSLPWPPGLVCLKLVTQDASRLRFR